VRNEPSRSSKVVDSGTNRKLVCDFLLVLNNCNLSAILPRLSHINDIRAFVRRKPLFSRPYLVPSRLCYSVGSVVVCRLYGMYCG